MNKEEYLSYLEDSIGLTLDDPKFNNYKRQLAARKLSPDFNRSYKEGYLWDRAIYLSSNGVILLDEGFNNRLSIKSLREAAEIFENLSYIAEEYDKEYCIIISALCYDLSGYQANARCLTRRLDNYILETESEINLNVDNYIISQIRFILLKNIFSAKSSINNNLSDDIGIFYFNKAVNSWYDVILNGVENTFLYDIDTVYKYYLNEQNIHISHLLFLLRSRIRIYQERSIWNNLFQIDEIKSSSKWEKYIKLLAHDIYDRNTIKDPGDRVSKFEFWISQLRAVQAGILSTEENYVLQMPTSAGKTFIAELAILDALIRHAGKKCIYVAPFRALTNEKESELGDYISKLGFTVSALSGSYELDEYQNLILEETDVLIATPEKIDLLLRVNPDYFNSVSLIVVDEGHIVGDISSRSSLLEFLIIRLKLLIEDLRVIFISAVMPPANANEYSLWLSAKNDNVIRSKLHTDSSFDEEWEPTRKLIGRFDWTANNNGRITYKNISTDNEETQETTNAFIPSIIKKWQYGDLYPNGTAKKQTSASLAFELAKDGNCLVFCAQVRDTERVGNALLDIIVIMNDDLGEVSEYFKLNRETESYFFSKKWYGENSYITKCIERGVGVHFGDMPEAVRRAVEADYSSGKLRILLATNTVGQGLNFPIKHLIVHSTIINGANGTYLSVRDFWNLIGRAGRAGKETEGQIVFVIKSYTDEESYYRYTEKTNIEPAYSMFFNVLNAMVNTRINEDELQQDIKTLSEPYLLSVLSEEILGTDDEAIIEQMINASLFKVQIDAKGISMEPIERAFTSIVKSIREDVSPDSLKAYGETGFSINSNQAIDSFVQSHSKEILNLIEQDDYLGFLKLAFELFSEEKIEEVQSDKINRINGNPSDYYNIALLWINGAEINELQDNWREISIQPNQLNTIISEGFYFRYPWGISAFFTILLDYVGQTLDNMPEGLRNLSSYLKFGVNTPSACLARSIGIKNRDIALLLSQKSNSSHGRDFIKWVANLTNEDINGFEVNPFDAQNILNVAIKLAPNRYIDTPESFEFSIKGVTFENNRKLNSLSVEIEDSLLYEREPNNQFDPYAIKLYKNDGELGYVPREYSRILSVELDINQTLYDVSVIAIDEIDDHKAITVRMMKRN